jgi:hypothetical protein
VVRGPGIEDVDLSLFQYFDIDDSFQSLIVVLAMSLTAARTRPE